MEWELGEEFETPGGTMRWRRFGDGDDPVVLVHGTPYSSFLWRDIAPALARTRTVFVFDHLGFGRSEQREGQDLGLAAHARNFAALLDHWGLSSPSVVAHDIGGAVALRTLLLERREYRDLTLFDAVSGGDWERGLFRLILEHAEVFGELPEYAHEALVAAHLRHATHMRLPAGCSRRVPGTVAGSGGAGRFLPPVQPDQAGGHRPVRGSARRHLLPGPPHLGARGPHPSAGVRPLAAPARPARRTALDRGRGPPPPGGRGGAAHGPSHCRVSVGGVRPAATT